MSRLHDLYCPSCGQEDLMVVAAEQEDRKWNYILCVSRECPNPMATQQLLRDPEIHHIVKIEQVGHDTDFVVKHPLRERIEGDGDLFNCSLLQEILNGPRPRGDDDEFLPFGTYRVTCLSDHSWSWESLP